MTLKKVTLFLMRAPDAEMWLRQAYAHMKTYNDLQGNFVLPAEHAMLAPIISAFAKDAFAFAEYVKALRDGATAEGYDALHDIYRTVYTAAHQAERRPRIWRATVLLAPQLEARLGTTVTYDMKVRVARFVEQRWKAMRMAHMAADRKERKLKRLSAEDRTASLAEFWRSIDAALESGTVILDGGGAFDELAAMLTPP